MTNREFFEKVIAVVEDSEMKAFAQERIEQIDKTNVKRKETAAEKRAVKLAEREPVHQAIMAAITTEPKTATTLIMEAGVELKPQAIPSMLKADIAAGVIVKDAVKVPGKGKHVGYRLA